MQRAALTTTHPHGYVLVRADRALGLVRISKCASTESKQRLLCRDWIGFDDFTGPTVAFVREPYARFMSSVPETMLRLTEVQNQELHRLDRVVIPQDIYRELARNAQVPITDFLELFLELVEYSFIDAHHEPQVNFLVDRQMNLRIDPFLYPTESFEKAISQIERRFGIATAASSGKANRGGAKPLGGSGRVIDLVRRATRTGVRKSLKHSHVLGLRYNGNDGPTTLADLNALTNRFTAEVKEARLGEDFRRRVLALYRHDLELWGKVREADGDIPASTINFS